MGENDKKIEEKNDDDNDEKTEEEEKKEVEVKPKGTEKDKTRTSFLTKDNILPADYSPNPRLSIAETAEIPAYKQKKRLSKLEMDEMKKQIDVVMDAMIKNPEEAARRYTVDPL